MTAGVFNITRRIEIDAGHRLKDHGGKCKGLHGHRYVIEATCRGVMASDGMVVDFGFIKAMMMDNIHKHCDHALILCQSDPLLTVLKHYAAEGEEDFVTEDVIKATVAASTFCLIWTDFGPVYIIDNPPTAEALARHWYIRLAGLMVKADVPQGVTLDAITVYETPNCKAVYPG